MQHTYYQVGTYTRTRAHFLCHHLLTLSRPARPARPPPHLPTTPTFCRPQVLTDEDDSKEFPRVGLGTQTWTPQQGVVLNVDLVAHDDIEPYTPFLPSPFAPAVGDEDLSVLSHPLMDTLFELTPAGAAVPSVETTRSYNSNNSNSNNSNSNSNSNSSSSSTGGGLRGGDMASPPPQLLAAAPTKAHRSWLRMMQQAFHRRFALLPLRARARACVCVVLSCVFMCISCVCVCDFVRVVARPLSFRVCLISKLLSCTFAFASGGAFHARPMTSPSPSFRFMIHRYVGC